MTKSKETRIGVVVPAGNTVHAREFALLQPANVSFAYSSFTSPSRDKANFCDLLGDSMDAPITELRAWGAEAILIGCTTASMLCFGDAFRKRLEQMAGAPVITAAAAATEAFRALKLKNIAVTTPYSEVGNKIVSDFLTNSGLKVAAIKGLALDRTPEMWKNQAITLKPEQMYDYSLEADVAGAEAMFMPCTGISCLESLQRFETTRRKPALSSVQAGYWATMRKLGLDGRKPGFGRLVEAWDF